MQVIKRKLTVVALTLMAIVMAVLGFATYNTANANFTADQVALTMDGASVRLVDYNGLRFTAKMSSEHFDALEDADYDSVEYGMFLMPASYAEKIGELNQANTFDGGKYVWGEEYTDATVEIGGQTKYRILHTTITPEEKGNEVELKASVVTFKPQNIATEYTACAYIKAVKGADVTYNFATNAVDASMLEVAYENIPLYEAEADEDAVAVLEGYETAYINWYKDNNDGVAPQGSYTVKYVAGSEVIKVEETVATEKLIEEVSVNVSAPRGYLLADGQADVVTGKVCLNNLELTVNVVAKPVIDITAQSIGGTIGILGRTCNLTHQKLDLPVDIGGLQVSADSVVIHLNDTGWDAPLWASYDSETQTLTVTTAAVKGFMDKTTGGKTVKNVTIEGKNAFYKAKVELLGYNYPLVVLETADDFVNKFDTKFFDDRANGGRQYSYNSYVLYNDIVLDGSVTNVTYTENGNNKYDGVIDGRGHKLENINTQAGGLINYKFAGTIKNIVLDFDRAPNDGWRWGVIAWHTDGGTFDNVYISGSVSRESLCPHISENGVTFNNVVLNFDDGGGYVGKIQCGYSGETGIEYVTQTNVYTAFGNANFFTEIEGKTFGNFTSEGNTLYFCGRAIYSK